MTNRFENLKKAVEQAAETSNVHQPVDANFPLQEVDSLGRAEIIVAVESEFSIQLTNQEIMDMKTYGDLIDIIKGRCKC